MGKGKDVTKFFLKNVWENPFDLFHLFFEGLSQLCVIIGIGMPIEWVLSTRVRRVIGSKDIFKNPNGWMKPTQKSKERNTTKTEKRYIEYICVFKNFRPRRSAGTRNYKI